MHVFSLSPWLSDIHTIRFSVRSGCFLFLNCCCPPFGCARRHHVSTYASVLAGGSHSLNYCSLHGETVCLQRLCQCKEWGGLNHPMLRSSVVACARQLSLVHRLSVLDGSARPARSIMPADPFRRGLEQANSQTHVGGACRNPLLVSSPRNFGCGCVCF